MVNSPCINICKLDISRICIGCGRTIDEIAAWTAMNDREKIAVLNRVKINKGLHYD
jgi:predicted Fe-S protein YdhL (DUF1289 family)